MEKLKKHIKEMVKEVMKEQEDADLKPTIPAPPPTPPQKAVAIKGGAGLSSSEKVALERMAEVILRRLDTKKSAFKVLDILSKSIEEGHFDNSLKEAEEKNEEEKKHIKEQSMTWGTMPTAEAWEENWVAQMGDLDAEYEYNLQGQDGLAFSYAMKLAGVNRDVVDSVDYEDTFLIVDALVNCEEPEDLTPGQFDKVEAEVEEWEEYYPGESLCDTAHSLAGSIMETLGYDWV